MKSLLLLSVLMFFYTSGNTQILKDLGRKIKNDTEWRIRQKAAQQVNKTIDTLVSKATKPKEKNQPTNQPVNNTPAKPQTTISQTTNAEQTSSTGINKEEQFSIGEGYIELYLSATEIFRGGMVIIYGTSLKYADLKNVQLEIKGDNDTETETLPLHQDGAFSKGWQAETAGDFVVTVKSSDGKAKKSMKLTVLDMDVLDDWTNENDKQTTRALKQLQKNVALVDENLGQKDKAELKQKMDKIEANVAKATKLFGSLNTAMNGLGDLAKKGIPFTPELTSNLSKLNDLLFEQKTKMKQLSDAAAHEPYDNTVCEYLVMVNEACAAFSTFSNIWSKSVATIVKNIVLDKGVPKGAEIANSKSIKPLPADYDVLAKQPAKLFATAQFDAESLASGMGMAGFTGDLVQYTSDFLMKTYCGVFKGTLKHDYEVTYRNEAKVVWWKNGYATEASITFRYPKKSSGGIIKMKGNIEGNAVRFSFYQDIEQMDEFKDEMKGRAKLTALRLYAPPSVPFATSQKDDLGFGAIARGLATPAYFNIPVDAEFDTDNNTIKIFLNDALIDFTPMVKFTYGYIAIAAGIPLVTRCDFPINKARLTLNAVVSKNNELIVEKGAKNNLVVKGKGTRHIGDAGAPIEHKINYTLIANKE